MKTSGFHISLLIILFIGLGTFSATAQKDQAFWDKYDQVRLYIANHNAVKSIKILEELHQVDTLDPNVNYLLGVSLIIKGKQPERSVHLFEMADKQFSQLWDNPGVGPPEHLFYYMILAYCRNKQCNLAKEALVRLEEIYRTEDLFNGGDDYYLIDGRKWANLCKEPTVQLLDFSERLRKPNLKVRTRLHILSTFSTLYGVQVAALLEPQMTNKLEGLKNVEVYVDQQGVYRYVIGNFTLRSQAEKLLEIVTSEGYVDAFVVEITDDERYPFEVITLDDRSPKAKISGHVDYRIQLAAFKESLPDESAKYYLMVDSISEISLDDLTLLTVGNYISYGNALERREELHLMGFKDAFIVAFNHDRKVSINDARQYLRKIEK